MNRYSFFARASSVVTTVASLRRGRQSGAVQSDDYAALYAALRRELDVADKQSSQPPKSEAADSIIRRMATTFGTARQSADVAD